MRSKIYFPEQGSETFEEVFSSFIISQTSKGVAAVTIRNYHLHLRSISKHLDIGMPFCSLTKRHLESMVVSMRAAGLNIAEHLQTKRDDAARLPHFVLSAQNGAV